MIFRSDCDRHRSSADTLTRSVLGNTGDPKVIDVQTHARPTIPRNEIGTRTLKALVILPFMTDATPVASEATVRDRHGAGAGATHSICVFLAPTTAPPECGGTGTYEVMARRS